MARSPIDEARALTPTCHPRAAISDDKGLKDRNPSTAIG